MAISCVKCGRQYDVTLFQFGRTINCACGERVGFEHKLNLPRDEKIKFFADVMAARLVKWLRAMGIDTAWQDAVSDKDLVRNAIEENRFILTLDKKLTEEWRVDNVLQLESENVFAQLRQVIEHFNLKMPENLFTRCLVCNTPLRKIKPESVTGDLPSNVLKTHDKFRFCDVCDKFFWEGSHALRMRRVIENLFGESG